MKEITLYQTLKDKDYLLVEENGPFDCKWENTWLGDGYYFWEEFIEVAHWWGENHRKGNYIICEAQCDFDENCLDLVGNMSHIRQFRQAIKIMNSKGLITKNTTVSKVIRFLLGEFKSFYFQAIRIYGINSISSKNTKYSNKLIFEINKPQYFDALPALQLCLFSKNALNLRNYKIVYPDHYREDYDEFQVF